MSGNVKKTTRSLLGKPLFLIKIQKALPSGTAIRLCTALLEYLMWRLYRKRRKSFLSQAFSERR